jgi:hypothetical protein
VATDAGKCSGLASFRDIHRGRDIVVCGCGESLTSLRQPERFVTIGVNDVGRLFQPNYLVVIDGREHFKGDRFHYVETSEAEYIFTQRSGLGIRNPNVVQFRLGEKNSPDASDPEVLPFSCAAVMTPYIAVCLAIYMGARNIGLIGVDLTDRHFFGDTGVHQWTSHVAGIDAQFEWLTGLALERGARIFNLSETSRLASLPQMGIETFAALTVPGRGPMPGEPPLRIVSYATTPLVGVPAILARCINACTPHRARCVWPTGTYQTGIAFGSDLAWAASPARVVAEIEAADVVVLHNGKIDDRHRALIETKPVVTMAHNYMDNVHDAFVRRGFPGVVVGQYQATLPEFRNWTIVPNPVPSWEEAYQPARKHNNLTIVYTPSDRHPAYARDHPLWWHGKGYSETMRILDRLANRHKLRLVVPRETFLAHAEILELKRRAHIVIDECVTGSYHRNSLEGLATGCVVVNGVGLLPGVLEALRHCAGDRNADPFVHADLQGLEQVLETLIDLGPDLLCAMGASNREWFARRWDFGEQWRRFWRPAIEHAIWFFGKRAGMLQIGRVA